MVEILCFSYCAYECAFLDAGRIILADYQRAKASIPVSSGRILFSDLSTYLLHIKSMLLNFGFNIQVISWVLGEYGTADGKYSASYISGKLCDVADAYSSDETVKVVPLHSNMMHL